MTSRQLINNIYNYPSLNFPACCSSLWRNIWLNKRLHLHIWLLWFSHEPLSRVPLSVLQSIDFTRGVSMCALRQLFLTDGTEMDPKYEWWCYCITRPAVVAVWIGGLRVYRTEKSSKLSGISVILKRLTHQLSWCIISLQQHQWWLSSCDWALQRAFVPFSSPWLLWAWAFVGGLTPADWQKNRVGNYQQGGMDWSSVRTSVWVLISKCWRYTRLSCFLSLVNPANQKPLWSRVSRQAAVTTHVQHGWRGTGWGPCTHGCYCHIIIMT